MSIYNLGNDIKEKLKAIKHPLAMNFHWHDANNMPIEIQESYTTDGTFFIINDKQFKKDDNLKPIYYEIRLSDTKIKFQLLFGHDRKELRDEFIAYTKKQNPNFNFDDYDITGIRARISEPITIKNKDGNCQPYLDEFTNLVMNFYTTMQPKLIAFLNQKYNLTLDNYEPKPLPTMKELDLKGKPIYKMSHGTKLKAHHEQMLSDDVIIIHEKTGKKQPELFKKLQKGDIFYLCLGSDKALLIGEIIDGFVENNYYEVKGFEAKSYLQRKYKVVKSVLDSKKDDKIIVKKEDGNFMTERGFPSGNNTISVLNPDNYDFASKKIFEPFFGVTVIDSLIPNHKPIKKLPNIPLNRILYGAPGTGKTYNSISKAIEIADNELYEQNKGGTKEERAKIQTRFNELQESGQIEFVTFHQNYSYEDFILGIKPTIAKGINSLQFERHEGIFYRLCKKALNDEKTPYVIIIDEINRANISKVFGELITLLEPDKRIYESNELLVTLPNGGEDDRDFGVPNNLYIIGTMNTADKSISLLDIALRRRFEFVPYMPDYTLVTDETKRNLLEHLNKGIFKIKNSTDFLLGHSFFMNETDVREVLHNKIIPLLMEYFLGKMDVVSELFEGSEFTVEFDIKEYKWKIE
jgi:5-methylcytosine-specific restriction protein B